jgi:hypothetical protein
MSWQRLSSRCATTCTVVVGCKRMRALVTCLAVFALLVAGGSALGLVGFHYPRVVQNEPLRNPQTVVHLDGADLALQSGAVITVEAMDSLEISNKLSQSAFQIDVESGNDGTVAIYARQNGWVCGTPWAQPIRIPLIRDTVYRNRRHLIALGSYVGPSSQPDGAANRSRPVGSETNRTSSAAGSGR